jgi:hypothetical protein
MRLQVKQRALKVIPGDLARIFGVSLAQAKAWANDGPLPARFTEKLLSLYSDPDLYFDVVD